MVKIKKTADYLYDSDIEKTSSNKLDEKILSQDIDQFKQETKERDWYIFVVSFLSVAKNSCDNIMLKKKLSNEDKFILIGIIYNVKHGIEIIIKAFSRTVNKKIDGSDYDHDINKLMSSFKKKIGKQNENLNKEMDELEKIVGKYYELNFLNNYLKNSFVINDLRNTFFKYPENKANIKVNYSKFLSQINISDIRNIRNDIDRIIEISVKIKKLIK